MQNYDLKSFGGTRFAAIVTALAMASVLGGCAGISGYQTVMNRTLVQGGKFQNVHVDCPLGKKVIGGGFNFETPDDIKIFSSDPSDGQGNLVDHSWNVFVQNAGTKDRQVTAIAICAF